MGLLDYFRRGRDNNFSELNTAPIVGDMDAMIVMQQLLAGSGIKKIEGMFYEEYSHMFKGQNKRDTYRKMDNDSTVGQLMKAIELVALGVDYRIEPAKYEDQEPTEQQKKIADFVKDVLFDGMNISRSQFVKDVFLNVRYGYSLFEIYFEKIGDTYFPRLQYIKPESVQKRQTKEGSLGITQVTRTKIEEGENKDKNTASIPAYKLVLFTYDQQSNDEYEGNPLYRKIARDRFYKDKFQTFEAIFLERLGVPPVKVTVPQGTDQSDKDKLGNIASQMRSSENSYMIEEVDDQGKVVAGFSFANTNAAANDAKLSAAIERYEQNILNSYFAQFLYMAKSEKGSYGMARNSTDFFFLGVESLVKEMVEIVNKYLIPKIVAMNFGVQDQYPKLDFGQVGFTDLGLFGELINKITTSGSLSHTLDTENYIRRSAGMPEITEEERDDAKSQRDQTQATPPTDQGMSEGCSCGHNHNEFSQFNHNMIIEMQNLDEEKKKILENSFNEYEKDSRRKLTFAEKRVNFKSIKKKTQKIEDKLKREYSELMTSKIDDVMKQVRKIVASNDTKAINDISIRKKSDLVSLIVASYKDSFELGKNEASEEMSKDIPPTKKELQGVIALQTKNVVDNQIADMEKIAKTVVRGEVNKTAGINKVDEEATARKVEEQLQSHTQKAVAFVATVAVMGGLNTGRRAVFDKYADDVEMFQYSAVLDDRTTNRCLSLDGRTVKPGSSEFTDYAPPQHYNCRSIWVSVLKKDEIKPDLTGIPSGTIPVKDTLNDREELKDAKLLKK